MSLASKKFRNNKTGEVVSVIDSFENIAILENKKKMDVRELNNPVLYTEEIDPMSFFDNQSAYDGLIGKLKSIPIENIPPDEGEGNTIKQMSAPRNDNFAPATNESAIIEISKEEEAEMLMRKYSSLGDFSNSNSATTTTVNNFRYDENVDLDELPISSKSVYNDNSSTIPPNNPKPNPSIRGNIETNRQTNTPENPILTIFRSAKKNVDLKIKIEISDKIPRIDFIEMMEDSYDISIIDFLVDDITRKITEDPSAIKDNIRNVIKDLVYRKGRKSNRTTGGKKTTSKRMETKKTTKSVVDEKHQQPDTKVPELPVGFEKKAVSRGDRISMVIEKIKMAKTEKEILEITKGERSKAIKEQARKSIEAIKKLNTQ